MDHDELIALLSRYLDDLATPEECAQVEQLVCEHPKAADLLRDLATQQTLLQVVSKVEAQQQPNASAATAPKRASPSRMSYVGMAAAAVLVLAGSLWLVGDTPKHIVAHLEAEAGAAEVRFANKTLNTSGDVRSDDTVTVREQASAALIYPDGTRIQLSAGSIVNVSEDKRLNIVFLQKGALNATVAKQVATSFLFETPQAEAWVLGTKLALDTDETSTRLDVTEGLVRLSQRKGNASANVAAGESAMVARGMPVAAQPTQQRGGWPRDLLDAARRITRGDYIADANAEPEMLATVAVPVEPGQPSDQSLILQSGKSADAFLFTIPEACVFKMRIRSEKAGKIQVTARGRRLHQPLAMRKSCMP